MIPTPTLPSLRLYTGQHFNGKPGGGKEAGIRFLPEGYTVVCLQAGAYLGAYKGMAKAGSVCTINNNNNNIDIILGDILGNSIEQREEIPRLHNAMSALSALMA